MSAAYNSLVTDGNSETAARHLPGTESVAGEAEGMISRLRQEVRDLQQDLNQIQRQLTQRELLLQNFSVRIAMLRMELGADDR